MGRRSGGGDKIFQNKKEKKDFKRTTNNRSKRDDIIIACEDSVSSPAYFNLIIKKLKSLRLITQDSEVIPHDGSTHPTGILNNLKKYKNEYNKGYKDFEHKWIVIDRDIERVHGGGHTTEDFNNAIRNAQNARSNLNINVAYANDSFELWYLLHFDYRTTAILRDDILKKVIIELKGINPIKFRALNKDTIKTKETTQLIFEELLLYQNTAIKNAKKLLESHKDVHNPENYNPSTTIHKLVENLNTFGSTKITPLV